MKVFKLLLVSITYLLIGVLEVYSYFLFKADVIGMFVFLTICGFIVTFMSELDRTRRKNFLENIKGTQVIITGTEKLDIENLEYLEYNVSNGKVLK